MLIKIPLLSEAGTLIEGRAGLLEGQHVALGAQALPSGQCDTVPRICC